MYKMLGLVPGMWYLNECTSYYWLYCYYNALSNGTTIKKNRAKVVN